MRLIRAHPGGGQSDCLWLLPLSEGPGDVRLNREGTIQVLERFDGGETIEWQPTEWDDYLRADPRQFLDSLERAAGLSVPAHVPSSTARTLTCRVLAAIAATAVKGVHPIEIQSGIFDTSGYGGGPNDALLAFPMIPDELLRSRPDDFYDQAGYRFWIVLRDGAPVLAFEQDEGLAWTSHHEEAFSLMDIYEKAQHHLVATALTLLSSADQL
jgi:hypothetical protein